MTGHGKRRTIFTLLAGAAMLTTQPVLAQASAAQRFELPAQGLADALRTVASQSKWEILFSPDDVAGRNAPALAGTMTPRQAVDRLLTNTNLTAEFRDGTILIRGRSPAPGALTTRAAGEDGEIVVTGSRIRGARSAAIVTTVTGDQARNEGLTSMAAIIQTIPQNFGGGQNPGIGPNVPSASGVNVSSGVTINLRGLGSDATLTLLNGHRLAYNASRQSVDISSIPVSAVDRIEVVPDGASAIYGSDAVAGVANIILKRDYQGVDLSARLGMASDGGGFQQQYGALGGMRWDSGGILLAYDFEQVEAIEAGQRRYTSALQRGQTLFPFIRRHNVVLTGHQTLGPDVELAVDALFNDRAAVYNYPYTANADYLTNGALYDAQTRSFAVAPSLKWKAGGGWELNLAGMYGIDRTHYGSDSFSNGATIFSVRGCYCNIARTVEAGATGPLLTLPGGTVRVALGGGYRGNTLKAFRTVGSAQNIDVTQNSYFGYLEASLPVFGPAQAIAGLHELTLAGAMRYERYPDIDSIGTPKLGVIYAPAPDFSIKGSWGRSFRAPTLFQQFSDKAVSVYRATSLGGSSYPTPASAILLSGGSPDLKPERATTWTGTLDLHPRAIPGLQLQLSYYSVTYRDRIVAPVRYLSQSLSDAIYSNLVTLRPGDAAKSAAFAGAENVFYYAGPYDPQNVVAIVNNLNQNAARQDVHGFDLAANYVRQFSGDRALTLAANAGRITSRQQLSAGQPEVALAGTVFNPPHWKGRAAVTWTAGDTSLTTAMTYIDGNSDIRFVPAPDIDSMTMADVTLRHRTDGGTGLFAGLDIVLSLQNVFNARPGLIRQIYEYDPTYDSTNTSPVGRFISLGITRHW